MAFLDKMKDTVSKGIDTIGAKGKGLVEDTQAHLQIRTLKGQREKALERLGGVAYELCRKGGLADEAVKKACDEVDGIDRQIAAEEAKLKNANV